MERSRCGKGTEGEEGRVVKYMKAVVVLKLNIWEGLSYLGCLKADMGSPFFFFS